LEQLQAADPNIQQQYTFEGEDDAARRNMKVTPFAPSLAEYTNTGSLVVPVSYPAGWQGSGTVARTSAGGLSSGSRSTGSALKTNAAITLTTSGTIEFLIKADVLNDQGFALSGISGSGGTASRWYFFQNSTTDTNVARMTYGNNTPHNLIGGATGVAYNANDWYYVAQTWSITDGTVTLNAWVANLSAETPVLTQTISGATAVHQGGLTTLLRVGSLTDTANFFRGEVDAVAIYNSALGAETIQSHFETLTIPTDLSSFQITQITSAGPDVAFAGVFEAPTAGTYRIEASLSLLPDEWVNMGTIPVAVAGATNFSISDEELDTAFGAGSRARVFIRAVFPASP
jgi:hypothetical protein